MFPRIPATVFTIGAAIIDQYDTDDLHDPNRPESATDTGNTITIIDTFHDPTHPETTPTG